MAAVAAAGGAIRLAFFLTALGSPGRFWSQDDRDYLGVATHLHASYLAGSGRWFEVGLRRPPVYPLFIRLVYDLFGSHYAAVVAVQLALGVATIALTYQLAALQLPHRFALAAAALVAIDPASVVFTNQMLTETLFTLLLVVTLCLVVVGLRDRSIPALLAAGTALGLATLTRPVAAYLPVVLVATLLLTWRGRTRTSLLLSSALVAGYALPVGTWVVANEVRTGVPIVSTIDGHNMLDYRAVGALVESGERPWDARAYVARRLAGRLHGDENAAEVSRAQLRLGVVIQAEHPAGAAKSWAKGEARLLLGPAKAETATLLSGRQGVSGRWLIAIVALNQLITLVIVAAGCAGAVALLLRRLRASALWLSLTTAAFLVVVSGGPEAYSRFRVPVTPFLAVLAAGAASVVLEARPSLRRGGRGSTPRPLGSRPAT